MTQPRDPRPDPTPRRVLQCNACGRCNDCSAEELLRYTRTGWPRCCDQVMAFYTEATHPLADAPTPPTSTE